MRAFEVHLNGKRLCVAGFDGDGVLNTVVNHLAGPGRDAVLELRIGGLISSTDEHVDWHYAKLSVGDEITLKIIETDSADKPTNRIRTDPEQAAKAYIDKQAERFGWKVIKRRRKTK